VIQVGVCGTDLHIHHGDFNAKFPLIPGHELVGTVAALGDGVTRFRIGEQVTVNPNIPCGYCSYCLSGRVILREITIKGSFAEMTSFGAAIAALRAGRARTDGIITHRFGLDDYAAALDTVANDNKAHKVVIVV
jgi:D-arabinitol dehydrogenase (NADP+)